MYRKVYDKLQISSVRFSSVVMYVGINPSFLGKYKGRRSKYNFKKTCRTSDKLEMCIPRCSLEGIGAFNY